MNKSEPIATFAKQKRKELPPPSRDELDSEQELQCRYIGGSFIRWMKEALPTVMGSRQVLRALSFEEPEFVVTTSLPGLVAMDEILKNARGNFTCLLSTEFDQWCAAGGELDWRRHIHHWNLFRPLEPRDVRLAEALAGWPVEQMRVHEIGEQWHDRCGRGCAHAWRWTGTELELVRQNVIGFVI